MTGGFEAAGDIATGALLGRAVEPRAGEAAGDRRHGLCLNCGTALIGDYCHACGQNGHVHRTLASMGHDLLHGAFHFEGKIWRTLPMLAWRPGDLTRRYIHGERARFVSPLALFLFTVFLMFAVISVFAGHIEVPEGAQLANGRPVAVVTDAINQQTAKLETLGKQRAKAVSAGKDTTALDARRAAINKSIGDDKDALDAIEGPKMGDFNTGYAPLDRAAEKAFKNPNLMFYKLQTSAYKFSWALIPISTPFVWLMFFWRRRFKVYDHAIFVTYSLSFMMFLVIVLTLAGVAGLPSAPIALAATFIPPIHIYRQLRGAYSLGRFSALARTFLLGIFASIALTLFMLLLLVLGVME